jgi:large subunit ribosomal protein L21
VEKLEGDHGSAIEFSKVVALFNDEGVVAGKDVASAKVTAEIVGEGRGDKIRVFKFKRKKQYKRTIGHRQDFTEVEVKEIIA